MNPVTGSPIADPTVTVGVETFALRYSLIAEYKISEWGVDVGALLRSLDSRNGDPKRFFYTCQLFAACVAHQFAAKGEPVPTAEQWMTRLSEDRTRLRKNGEGVRTHRSGRGRSNPKTLSGSEGGGDAGSRQSARQLTPREREEENLKLWAFCTSPHGLGLSSIQFWCSTSPEIKALQQQWERVQEQPVKLYADLKAVLYNAHFKSDGVPWIASDFLGITDRDKRKTEKMESERTAIVANTNLMKIKKGAPPTADVPAWAIGEYHHG